MIDIKPLEDALNTFDEIIERYDRETYDNAIRDAVIQRFEYTYSLAIKTLARYLKENLPLVQDSPTFNEIIRNSNKLGLLKNNLEVWNDYRTKRNLTSHTYNQDVAALVINVTRDFQAEIHFLINQLKAKL